MRSAVRDVSTCQRGCGCCEVAQQVERRTVSGMSDTSNPLCTLLGPRAQQVGILEDTELLVTSAAANRQNDVGIRRTDGVRELRSRQHVGRNRRKDNVLSNALNGWQKSAYTCASCERE